VDPHDSHSSPPGNFQQILEVFPVATPTGLNDLVTACIGATFADQLLAVEVYMGGAGLMPPVS
jgi:hypothetical protein